MPPTSPAPIKILRVIDRINVGGPAIHVLLLTHYFNPAEQPGWLTTLVYGAEGPLEGNMLPLADELGVQPRYIASLGRELNPLRDLGAWWQLIQLIRRERPDIVHTHKSKAGVVGRLAAWMCRVPVIIHTYHGHVLSGYFGPLKNRLFTTIERAMGTLSDYVIAVSPKVREDLLALRIASPEKMQVIYLGLDLIKFAAKPRNSATLRRECDVSLDTPLIGIVARLAPIKRIALFLKAAEHLHPGFPNAHFVIVGDGDQRAELERQVSHMQGSSYVHFLGFRRDLENILPDLDVLVLTSENEGSPVSLIEGLASGCAVVSTDVGGVPDVVQDRVTGLLVPSRHKPEAEIVEGLVAHVSELLRNPALRKQLGQAGQEDVLTRFSIQRLVSDLRALYRQSLNQKVL